MLKLKHYYSNYQLAFILIISCAYLTSNHNLTDLITINNNSAIIGLIALGALFVYLAGYFDLSVGAYFAFYLILFGYLQTHTQIYIAIFLTLFIAGLFGCLQGITVTFFGKNLSPLSTLCIMFVIRGYVNLFNKNSIENSNVSPSLQWQDADSISCFFVLYTLLTLCVYFTISKTKFGLSLTAMGFYKKEKAPVELRSKRTEILTFSISSCFTSLASIIFFSKNSIPSISVGTGYELDILIILIFSSGFFYRRKVNILNLYVLAFFLTYIDYLSITQTLSQSSIYLIKGSILLMSLFIEKQYSHFKKVSNDPHK